MKRSLSFILLIIFSVAIILGIFQLVSQQSDAATKKCHLIWDAVDKVWWCLGSPIDCVCTILVPEG